MFGQVGFSPARPMRTSARATATQPNQRGCSVSSTKAVEADDLARFVEADQVAHPAEQRNIGDVVVSAHHPVAHASRFLRVQAWLDRGLARPAVQRRLQVTAA